MTVFDENPGLLLRFRAGERAALTQVYDHYLRAVGAIVRRGTRLEDGRSVPAAPLEAQKDLIQETFVRVFSEKSRLSFVSMTQKTTFAFSVCMLLLAGSALAADKQPVQDPSAIQTESVQQKPSSTRLNAASPSACQWA